MIRVRHRGELVGEECRGVSGQRSGAWWMMELNVAMMICPLGLLRCSLAVQIKIIHRSSEYSGSLSERMGP